MDAETEASKITFDRDMVREIVALIEQAQALERERIAKFLESQASPYDNYPQYFARLIRENATAQ